MAKYINADALEYEVLNGSWWDNADEDVAYDLVHGAPTVDVVLVRRGEWLKTDAYPHHMYCSACHTSIVPNEEMIDKYGIPTNFCPHCGARMDKQGR